MRRVIEINERATINVLIAGKECRIEVYLDGSITIAATSGNVLGLRLNSANSTTIRQVD